MIPQSYYRCWVEVDLNALRANVTAIRTLTGPAVKLLAVVKADAYGHGLPQIAQVLMQCGVDGFGVANLTEALAIRQLGGNGWPIILFGSALSFELEKIVEQNITVTISSLDEARHLNAIAAAQKRVHPIHIEIDTGMGRVGLFHETAASIIHSIADLANLRLDGLYTHFPSADEDPVGSRRALALFLQIADSRYIRHAANSAALFNIPESHLNLVRPGLALYGLAPGLTPILSFKSRVAFVKEVAPGRTISYGQTFTAQQPMKIATIATGYGDGFSRQLSNRAHVLIAGQRCAVVGRVTMDQIMVDVSNIDGVQSGDEVVLIGRLGAAQITATEVAEWAGTISWEILCGISKSGRVPRVYTGVRAS